MVGLIGASGTTSWYKAINQNNLSQQVEPNQQNKNMEDVKKEESKNQLDPELHQQIQQYVSAENKVKAHEQAHKAVGGQYAGGISYDYKQGPDGKQYVVGGEVPIQAPEGKDPEDSIRIMEQVRRAALAPTDPSPQDLKVAASATKKIMESTNQLRLKGSEKEQEYKGDAFELAKQTYQNNQAAFHLMNKPQTIFDQAI